MGQASLLLVRAEAPRGGSSEVSDLCPSGHGFSRSYQPATCGSWEKDKGGIDGAKAISSIRRDRDMRLWAIRRW